jgi:hypothetical protein
VTTTIFLGPTLAPAEIDAAGQFVRLPPVAQGDVYRAVRRGARAIGIVDGFFSGAPSVWHKEILWAMAEGVPVFGSASMGALRAAELCAFGMHGVGRIFEDYRDGTLEDDDEVAVQHGPAEMGYLPASEPMVNIRATLEAAVAKGVIGSTAREALERFGKSLFFGERNWPALLNPPREFGVPASALAALGAWLPQGRVDQKRLDALAMLAEMRASQSTTPSKSGFHFEWTYLWDEFVARAAEDAGSGGSVAAQRILDELRLEGPEGYRRVEARALLRAVARSGGRAEPVAREAESDWLVRFRRKRGLYSRGDLDRWMQANDLEPGALETLIRDETQIEALRDRFGRALEAFLVDALRLAGDYPRLAERARRKHEAIEAAGHAGTRPTGVAAAALRLWWFETRLRRPVPDDVAAFAVRLGFADARALDLALYRERIFLSFAGNST